MSESPGAAGSREVAYRMFAAEYDDATLEYSEEDEERAPNYVVTPTGARVNRLFVVGVLTEVERVSDDVLRGRIVDPTGAFVVYAGQYQPDPQSFLERAEPPAFVAVTGKARTFTPDGSDRVLTSVRPESINEVDAETRDRWLVNAADQTIERVGTAAAALAREERGDDLRDVLLADGVDEGLAVGIPLAIDHYGTTEAYLAALRNVAIQAVEVVAGERDEVQPLDVAPDEGGPADVDLTESPPDTVAIPTTTSGGEADAATPTETAGDDAPPDVSTDDASTGVDAAADDGTAGSTDDESPEPDAGTVAATAETSEDPAPDQKSTTASEGSEGDVSAPEGADEMYELDEEERERVTEEYGTEFTTGAEVDEPGEAGIETPGSEPAEDEDAVSDVEDDASGTDEVSPAADEELSTADEDELESTDPDDGTGDETGADDQPGGRGVGEEQPGAADAEDEQPDSDDEQSDAGDVDLEAAAVDAMAALDDGDGADRAAVVDAVTEEYGVDEEAVRDAIQDALMSGKCYEPTEDQLKAI